MGEGREAGLVLRGCQIHSSLEHLSVPLGKLSHIGFGGIDEVVYWAYGDFEAVVSAAVVELQSLPKCSEGYSSRLLQSSWMFHVPAVKKNPYMPEILPPHAAWPCSLAAARMPE